MCCSLQCQLAGGFSPGYIRFLSLLCEQSCLLAYLFSRTLARRFHTLKSDLFYARRSVIGKAHLFINSQQTLAGNNDRNTVVRHELRMFNARYVRFRPQAWRSKICMRVEISGCAQRKLYIIVFENFVWHYGYSAA